MHLCRIGPSLAIEERYGLFKAAQLDDLKMDDSSHCDGRFDGDNCREVRNLPRARSNSMDTMTATRWGVSLHRANLAAPCKNHLEYLEQRLTTLRQDEPGEFSAILQQNLET